VIATGDDGPWELYNLGTDRSEMHNLMASNSAKGQQLTARWKEIDDGFTKERNSAPLSTKPLQPAAAPVTPPGK
jgi:hypothetical protein